MNPLLALVPLLVVVSGCVTSRLDEASAQRPPEFQLARYRFPLGDTNVFVLGFQHGLPTPTYINVHDDENTAVEAGKAVIEESSGRLLELAHTGHRLIRFRVDEQSFAVDPNRIFTEAGIRRALDEQGADTSGARWTVRRFARKLLERFKLDEESVIVALHNTSRGSYSIESYRPGGRYAAAVGQLEVNPSLSRYDFFYVTDRRFYDYLRQRGFNTVLQDNVHVPDDGSLSVYFARKGIPYVNIEAEEGQQERQIEMIRAVRQMLLEFGLMKRK